MATQRSICFWVLIVLGRCTNPPPSQLVAPPIPDHPLFSATEKLDRWLQNIWAGKEEEAQYQELKKTCSETVETFCTLLPYRKALKKYAEAENQPPALFEKKEIKPIAPIFEKGKISNWKKMQRASVQELLAGLNTLNHSELKEVGKRALKDKRCPNPISVAVAATLEDYLPDSANSSEIAALYSRGGFCLPRHSIDREHFLTRSALFYFLSKKYSDAWKAIHRLEPRDGFVGRVLYWKYRILDRMGRTQEAEKNLKRLIDSQPLSFHALVALEEQKREIPREWLSKENSLILRSSKYTKINPLIQEVEKLKGFSFEQSSQFLASWLASDFQRIETGLKFYLLSLSTKNKGVETAPLLLLSKKNLNATNLEIAFPRAYWSDFERNSKIDPLFLTSIAHKESRFDPKAISGAQAMGLMQIHPDLLRKYGENNKDKLFEIPFSIAFSSQHFLDLRNEFSGNLPAMIAAYNAGSNPVKRWLTRYPLQDNILFIDLIPYRETRDYVGFVLANYFWYRKLYRPDGNLTLIPVFFNS